ncbi:MAG: sigma-70 family RNA polymerase sigma factor [Bacteroidota bacterium]
MALSTPSYTSAYSDEDLMELVQQEQHWAFTELMDRYQTRLHRFLYRYTKNHNDCEDLVQETFLRVHKSRKSYQRIAKFSTWMYTIAINLAKSLYKKNQKMALVSIHDKEEDPDGREMQIKDSDLLPDDILHQKLSIEKLWEVLDSLSPEFREVVILRDIEQLSYEEIAQHIGLAMGTVKSRINRGRAQLTEQLEGYVQLGT